MNDYLDVAVDLAKQAGEIMLLNFTLQMKKEWKNDSSPVTATDKEINSLVIKTLSEKFPTHGIIGEEESLQKKSDYQWVCDPIDGTVPFSHGYPTFTFSLALTKNGESIVGVIHDPIMDRMLTAIKGQGAFLNGKRISVSKQKKILPTSVINLSYHKRLLGIREKLITRYNCMTTILFSTVYSSMMVAYGEYLGEIFEFDKPWDCAAVKIIVEEAGGRVTDIEGNDQRYDKLTNGYIASNGYVHDELVEVCKQLLNK